MNRPKEHQCSTQNGEGLWKLNLKSLGIDPDKTLKAEGIDI